MRCTCGSPADYGPSNHNGRRRGICASCYADLPAGARHLYDPEERPWMTSGTWLDRP